MHFKNFLLWYAVDIFKPSNRSQRSIVFVVRFHTCTQSLVLFLLQLFVCLVLSLNEGKTLSATLCLRAAFTANTDHAAFISLLEAIAWLNICCLKVSYQRSLYMLQLDYYHSMDIIQVNVGFGWSVSGCFNRGGGNIDTS